MRIDEVKVEPVVVTSSPQVTYEDYYDDDGAFDSDFDSDEEYGSRKKKRKSARGSKVSLSYSVLSLEDLKSTTCNNYHPR